MSSCRANTTKASKLANRKIVTSRKRREPQGNIGGHVGNGQADRGFMYQQDIADPMSLKLPETNTVANGGNADTEPLRRLGSRNKLADAWIFGYVVILGTALYVAKAFAVSKNRSLIATHFTRNGDRRSRFCFPRNNSTENGFVVSRCFD